MQLTRMEKEELVADLAARIDESPVVGVLDMHSLPARQLQEIKKELVGDVDITMTRKTLIERAVAASGREDIDALLDNDAIMPALLFTEKNPFSLFKLIQEKKSSAAAQGGEIAPTDIDIPDGSTGLDPGPMLGKIQELGAPTSVEDGKISVDQSAVVVEAGEEISADVAEVLNALDIEPLEVGLDLKLVYEDGETFGRDVLEIDVDDYRSDVESAAAQAFNLAVNAGIMTDETREPIVQDAVRKARNLAVNAGILDEEVIEDLVRKASGEASALDAELDLDSVDIDEEPDGDGAGDGSDEADGADAADTDEETGEGSDDQDDGDEEPSDDDDEAEEDNDVTENAGSETESDDGTEVN